MQRPAPDSIALTPGVYMYRDADGVIIYVGKARILRRRVLSYFRDDVAPKTAAMLRRAVSIETISTTTEKEALLLESSLIKKHRPHYNIVLRDDKQYFLFRFNPRTPYPRLEIVRRSRRDGATYFGPYTSAQAARETWKLLNKSFGLRRCSDHAMKNRVRPCLYGHMGQCLAPCMGKVPEYYEHVRQVADVLSGNAAPLVDDLRQKMETASEALEFEKAAALRDTIRAIEKTVERQAAVLPKGGDMDAAGLFAGEKGLALGLICMRGGAMVDGNAFYWPGLGLDDAPEVLLHFTAQYYLDRVPPPKILLPWLPETQRETGQENEDGEQPADDIAVLEQYLSEKRGSAVHICAPHTPQENQTIDLASANAREEVRRRGENNIGERLKNLLHLPAEPRRIECVDVSHTGGMQTRVGLVVFTDGKADKSEWRQYAMPDGDGDDYGTLAAWIVRRLESGPPWPDLLLIDGGRGQIGAVAHALEEAGKPSFFPLAGIAKARNEAGHADRRAGNTADRIFLPGRSNPAPFREGSPELLFLQHIRDCTHHFAIGSHRRARAGAALSGELMRLPGIGPATARLLWDSFGSTAAMRAATLEDLTRLPGIGPAKGRALLEKLKKITV